MKTNEPDPRLGTTAPIPPNSLSPTGFDPDATFLCGQCFRWEKDETGSWHGLTRSHQVSLHPVVTPSGQPAYRLAGATPGELDGVWRPYLDWDTDYESLQERLQDNDPVLAAAIAFAPGLRLLRQDPWETLASFLISQNNGIPRIRRIVESLCACFGEPAGTGRPGFPSLERIARLSESDLGVCRAGYRTGYLIRTARQLSNGEVDLAGLGTLSYPEAREQLLRLHGVGVKVADCTLLFSGTHQEAFPVDRWVIRIMRALYPQAGTDTPSLQRYAADRWGVLAGLAQEYLFHYARHHRI